MYDGGSNPVDHLMHFQQVVTFVQGNDALICSAFPLNL